MFEVIFNSACQFEMLMGCAAGKSDGRDYLRYIHLDTNTMVADATDAHIAARFVDAFIVEGDTPSEQSLLLTPPKKALPKNLLKVVVRCYPDGHAVVAGVKLNRYGREEVAAEMPASWQAGRYPDTRDVLSPVVEKQPTDFSGGIPVSAELFGRVCGVLAKHSAGHHGGIVVAQHGNLCSIHSDLLCVAPGDVVAIMTMTL